MPICERFSRQWIEQKSKEFFCLSNKCLRYELNTLAVKAFVNKNRTAMLINGATSVLLFSILECRISRATVMLVWNITTEKSNILRIDNNGTNKRTKVGKKRLSQRFRCVFLFAVYGERTMLSLNKIHHPHWHHMH